MEIIPLEYLQHKVLIMKLGVIDLKRVAILVLDTVTLQAHRLPL